VIVVPTGVPVALRILLCIVLIGLLVFVYMLIVKPAGTLTVTYQLAQPPVAATHRSPASTAADDTMPCPRCAETIKRAAKMCRFCQLDLTAPEQQGGPPA
jgi:hypothetical protein